MPPSLTPLPLPAWRLGGRPPADAAPVALASAQRGGRQSRLGLLGPVPAASLGLPWPFHREPSHIWGRAPSGGGLPASRCRLAFVDTALRCPANWGSFALHLLCLSPRSALFSLKKINVWSSVGGEVLHHGAWRVQDTVKAILLELGQDKTVDRHQRHGNSDGELPDEDFTAAS